MLPPFSPPPIRTLRPPSPVGTGLLIATLAAACLFAPHADARTWTSPDGSKTFEAELAAYDAATGMVKVRLPNGSPLEFHQDRLSAEDIAYLKTQGNAAPSGGAATKGLPDELPDPDGEEADMSQPVQVFILLGQSNMLGFGQVAGDAAKSLESATKDGKYSFLVDDAGAWTTRKDVRNVRVMNFNDHKNDWLTPADTKNIGPEIGIGHYMGEIFDAPVMILKSCIGNRSLGWDLLPPGTVAYDHGGKLQPGYGETPDTAGSGEKHQGNEWYAGKQWDTDIASAKQVLENLDKYYPGAEDYEIAGFVFWQGDKDRYNAAHAETYETNLVNFIKALRKEFDAPNAKFVCATLGQTKKGAGGNDGAILDAQLAVDGEAGNYPDFQGNVATVYSNPLSQGGASNGHYGGNAITYMEVGLALGRAMAELLTP